MKKFVSSLPSILLIEYEFQNEEVQKLQLINQRQTQALNESIVKQKRLILSSTFHRISGSD